MIYLFNMLGTGANGLLYGLYLQLRDTKEVPAFFAFLSGMLICIIIPYLLGSLNFSIIVSKYKYNDDIRNYGSGNAGLTNMLRVYGKKGALYTLGGDVLKQIVSVLLGMLVFGTSGAYIAGTFCILGHIAPIFYHFKGGKGVPTAATMILLIDPVIFLCLFAMFALVVWIFRFISLGSMMAGFIYPALVYYRAIIIQHKPPELPSILFATFIALLIIFMHRENMRRIFHNEESRFSFKKKPIKTEEPEEVIEHKEKKHIERTKQKAKPNLNQKKKR